MIRSHVFKRLQFLSGLISWCNLSGVIIFLLLLVTFRLIRNLKLNRTTEPLMSCCKYFPLNKDVTCAFFICLKLIQDRNETHITGQFSDFHGMHSFLIKSRTFIVTLHVICVLLLIFVLQRQ